MTPVDVAPGVAPIVLAQPHSSDWIEPRVAAQLNERGLAAADTDWCVDRLYADLLPEATVVRAGFSRYVIDANRSPDDRSLYPGQNTTGLCPLVDFTGESIYLPGREPDAGEIARRRERFFEPYHAALTGQIERLLERHPTVLVFDCHSIADELPFLFQGRLPALNIGTHDGRSCDHELEQRAADVCRHSPFSVVVNGRFRGGWTTRHYGRRGARVQSMQLEIAQSAYLADRRPPVYEPDVAAPLRIVLAELLATLQQTLQRSEAG